MIGDLVYAKVYYLHSAHWCDRMEAIDSGQVSEKNTMVNLVLYGEIRPGTSVS